MLISNACSAAASRGSTQISAGASAWLVAAGADCSGEKHGSGGARRDAAGRAVQHLAEAGGALRDGKIGLGVFQLDRARAALPGHDLVEHTRAQDRGVQRAAVEQDGVHARALPQEIGEMPRDRAVGRVRKAPVAQTRLGAIGPRARIADREKAIERQSLNLVARDRRRLRTGQEARPPARQRDDVMVLSRAETGERALLQIPTRRDEVIPLRAGHPTTFRHKARLEQRREGEIDVVAAEQDMFADRNPPDVGDPTRRTGPRLEQTEIRGAAADVDHQDMPRLGGVRVPPFPQRLGRAVPLEPAIESRLRLLQKPHAIGKARFLRSIQREALRGGVERSRDRNGDVLRIERKAGSGEAGVPGVPQMAQDQRGGADGRDLLRRLEIIRSPGQDRRGPVGRMVTQPRLRRPHDPSGRFARPAPGEAADDPSLGSRKPAGRFRGAPVLRQIEERGQRRRLGEGGRAFPLRDEERLGMRVADERNVGERRVRRAEIDADGKPGRHHCGAASREPRPALLRADLKLNLPSPVRVSVLHPEFERAEFRDDRFDPHGDDLSCRNVGQSRKLDFQQAALLQLAFGVGQDLARRVAAAHGGREEAELCGLARHQAERAALDQLLGSLLHALRHDAERLDRRPEPRDGLHRRFQPDIARARGASLDAHAFAGGAVPPVDGGALGDREVRLEAFEFPDRLSAVPGRQQLEHPAADRLSLEHAAIEQHGGRDVRVRQPGFGRRHQAIGHERAMVAGERPTIRGSPLSSQGRANDPDRNSSGCGRYSAEASVGFSPSWLAAKIWGIGTISGRSASTDARGRDLL